MRVLVLMVSLHPLMQLVVLALTTSAISMTVSKAVVFKGVRARLKTAWPWLGELVSCPYCTSHWVALGVVALYRPRPVTCGIVGIDLFIAAMAIVALAAVSSGLIFRAFKDMPKE